ncbi:MAG: decaprenyl-phosphate phosphoribosyltransferase [Caulobacter sp.]|nr:decaprenyl-phosphate phosphoribosyltransferase [Caulobacter sp.]
MTSLPPVLALMRPHQWVKNAFVAVPLFFTPAALSPASLLDVTLAILCFCALSSGVYVLNDRVDLEADRRHPVKCHRPLAAGTVSKGTAAVLMVGLIGGGLAGAFAVAPVLGLVALAYLALNLVYSLAAKHVAILDVMLIAMGFVLRVEAGAAVIDVRPSAWIIIMSGLLALFLALAKRRDDLVRDLGNDHRRSLDGYNKPFLDVALAVVLGATLVGYLVYTTDQAVMARLGTPYLFATTPFVVAGILRYLQITLVEERSGSPTRILLRDRFLIAAVAGWLLTFAWLIHG